MAVGGKSAMCGINELEMRTIWLRREDAPACADLVSKQGPSMAGLIFKPKGTAPDTWNVSNYVGDLALQAAGGKHMVCT